MAVTLSPSNIDKPQSGDYGSSFFTDLEALFDFVNAHTHTGLTGSGTKLTTLSTNTVYLSPTITWGSINATTKMYPGVISIAATGCSLATSTSGGVLPTFYISEEIVPLQYIINSATQLTIYSFDNTITPIIRLGV